MTKSKDMPIVMLAEMLMQKQFDTKTISASLKLICKAFSFDCGLVYEIDKDSQFHLNEYYTLRETPFPTSFAREIIQPSYQNQLIQQEVTYIQKNEHSTADELTLFNHLSATSLLVSTIVDEHLHIYGLIVFLHAQETLLDTDLKQLALLLSMLEKYLGMRMYQNKLSFSQITLESILDNAGIDIYVNDFYTYDILYVNKSMASPYGGLSAFVGKKCWEVLFPGQNGPCAFCPRDKIIDQQGNPTKVYSWDYQRAFDGSWFRVFSAAFRWVDGRLAQIISSADITENKRNEEMVQYMANYDSLTNLPNRRMLVEECENRINRSKEGEKGYLLFFDIDGFKAVNDNLGHDAGDELLVKLGEFFSNIPMLKNAIYRNGGDEFVAILNGDIKEANIRSLAGFMHQKFQKPWVLKKGNAFCNISIGVACYPEDGSTPEQLLAKADQAMYHVKKSGGGEICFAYQLK